MSQRNSQFDVTEIDFETNYLPYNEVECKLDPEFEFKTQKNFQNQIKRFYQKLLSNTKRIISKLCYMIGKFSPFDPIIKQAFEDMQKLQEEWSYFNNQNIDKYCCTQKPKLDFLDKLKRQQVGLKKLKESQIKITPLMRKQNFLKNSLVQEQPLSIFNTIRSEYNESNQSLSFLQQNNTIPNSNSQYKFKLKDQFYYIKQFVFFQLHPKLTLQYDKILQKKVVLNCYILWNRKINRELKITQMAKLQMELTVQIKQKFPNLETKRKFFKGIGFKEQFVNQMNLTDRKPIVRDQNITFDADCRIHPIDQIIKLARSNEKSQIEKPYTEEELRALDEVLGLI